MTKELIVGLMSGTSVDGIDAVIVEFESSSRLTVVATEFSPFPDILRDEINQTAFDNRHLTRNSDSPLNQELAKYYAQASLSIIEKARLVKNNIAAIANHGQTVKHEPNAVPPVSLQLGCGQLIANLTGLQTITQFRQADLGKGGQGAPLMPAFHKAIFAQAEDTYILNLGGIANITGLCNSVVGFDTGPSNTLLDQWIEKHQGHRFDNNGEWADSGKVQEKILAVLMQDHYLHLPYPKSTGTDHYNLAWLNNTIEDLDCYSPEDVQATLLAFTVESIQLALQQLRANKGEIFVCGGGSHNSILMESLQTALAEFKMKKTDTLGIPADWVEAIGFAWLGYCHRHRIPSNLPSVTGATEAVVLGEKFNPQN
ncbi:anhydro-N-acetylmuramic acid kinase [Arenicella sp.]|nr:anhydro-N-acetylmuramic acid kinase [Arenicella sp.]